MAFSNAERQRRFRDRQQQAARAGRGLTPEQIADREAVASDRRWPVPPPGACDQIPQFLGWSRYDWSLAPHELVAFLGLEDAWNQWKAEQAEMDTQVRANAGASAR